MSVPPKKHLTPGPSPISHPPFPGRGENGKSNGKPRPLLLVPPLPAGAWAGDGRGAGGEVLLGGRRTTEENHG